MRLKLTRNEDHEDRFSLVGRGIVKRIQGLLWSRMRAKQENYYATMRFRASLFCYAFSSLVTGSPIDRFARKQNSQRILNESKPQPVDASRRLDHHSSAHFDAAPNSVGLLLTSTGAQEVVHVWLPLGTRVETRTFGLIPFCSLLPRRLLGIVPSNIYLRRLANPPAPPHVRTHNDADPQLAGARDAGAFE